MFNLSINSSQKTVTISDKVYYRDTPTPTPNLALLVTIVRVETDEEKGRMVTGKDGIYSITIPLLNMPSGTYEIRFYGSNTRPFLAPKGDWVSFIFTNPLNIEAVRFTGDPTFQVSEGITWIDVNGNEKTEVILDLMNLGTTAGSIAFIEFYFKRTAENEYAWRKLESFAFSDDLDNVDTSLVNGIQNTEAHFKTSFFLENKPMDYDFYCIFFNPLMSVALEEDTTTVLKVYDRGVIFNGIPDLAEYVEVTKLRIVNAIDEEQGSLPSLWANLEWENLKELPNSALYFPRYLRNGYNGSGIEVDFKLAQNIFAYGVWMYVTDENTPPPTLSGFENPFPAEFPGWYFMGDFVDPNISIQCPSSKWVGFWVGMKTRRTEKLKVDSGTGIVKLNYI